MAANNIASLGELLDEIEEAKGERDEISVGSIFKAAGERSFGPLLLVPGLIGVSPLSGIPGMPSLIGLMVALITSQILMGRDEVWLPQWLLRRSVSRRRFEKAMRLLRKVASFVDRLIKSRLESFAGSKAKYVIAACCLLVSLAAPFMEVVPFAITGVGAAVSAFGLGLLARDGLLALLAFGFCIATAVATFIGIS
jgi:hypothetical protein